MEINRDRVARVFQVIAERGYVSSEDLMQLIDIGIPIYVRLADHLGVPVAEVKRLAERRELEVGAVRAVVQAAEV